jgi:hypothetical protein
MSDKLIGIYFPQAKAIVPYISFDQTNLKYEKCHCFHVESNIILSDCALDFIEQTKFVDSRKPKIRLIFKSILRVSDWAQFNFQLIQKARVKIKIKN